MRLVLKLIQELFGKWMDRRVAEADARLEIAKYKAKAAAEIQISKAQADIKWDLAQVNASANSWKDEWWTIMLSIPLVLAFIPGLQPYVQDGFHVLMNDVPEWYLYAVGVAISAAFGSRKIGEMIGKSKGVTK